MVKGQKRPNVPVLDIGTDWLHASSVIPRHSLVIAKAKIDAVDSFFVDAIGAPNQKHILVLHGPTGSGKTAIIWSLTAHHSLNLVQIDELSNTDFSGDVTGTNDSSYLSTACANSAKFPALSLIKSSQTASDPKKRRERVMFIDDIEGIYEPHLFQLSRTLKLLARGIFVLTCADWYDICRRVKGFRELKVIEVSLNQLAPTFITKAVKYWAGEMAQVPQELIDSGDLRSCLFHVYMSSGWIDHVVSAKDSNLTMFHALGRLFYPLKQKDGNLWNPFLPDDRFIFHLYIHHNMLPFMANIYEATKVLDALSLDNYEKSKIPLAEYTLNVMIGSENRSPVKVRPSFARPEYLDIFKKRQTFIHSDDLCGNS